MRSGEQEVSPSQNEGHVSYAYVIAVTLLLGILPDINEGLYVHAEYA